MLNIRLLVCVKRSKAWNQCKLFTAAFKHSASAAHASEMRRLVPATEPRRSSRPINTSPPYAECRSSGAAPGSRSPAAGDGSDSESTDSDEPPMLRHMTALAAAADPPAPEPPTICCMSGCANCVWIEYAEALAKHYRDGGEAGRLAIEANVSDPSLKAFLLLELKTR